MYLDQVLENAVVKTIVRDRVERVWDDWKILLPSDVHFALSHPYIHADERRMLVGEIYFKSMRQASEPVTEVINKITPEQAFARIFQESPEQKVAFENRPYGIHMYLGPRDWKRHRGHFGVEDAIGYSHHEKLEGIWYSFSGTLTKTLDEFMQDSSDEHDMFMLTQSGNPVAEYDFLLMWKYFVGFHEVEHMHCRALGLESLQCHDHTLHEQIAFFNHHSLVKGIRIIDEESLRRCYAEHMEDNFGNFVAITRYMWGENGKVHELDTMMKKRVLPMALLELGDYKLVVRDFIALFERITALEEKL